MSKELVLPRVNQEIPVGVEVVGDGDRGQADGDDFQRGVGRGGTGHVGVAIGADPAAGQELEVIWKTEGQAGGVEQCVGGGAGVVGLVEQAPG